MKVAVIQLNAGRDKAKNIAKAVRFAERAIQAKAKLIALPEAFGYRGPLGRHLKTVAEKIPGPSTEPLIRLARRHRVAILAGSVCEAAPGQRKVYNTSILIDPRGRIAAKYRKIHLFDAVVNRKVLRESRTFFAGKGLATGRAGGMKLGLTVCYDLRFGDLYRRYGRLGCHILTVPSSFTSKTGEAHWEILLRARAIENLCFVLAPNQSGVDARGVPTYGNSMIIDPWGRILARAPGEGEGVLLAEINRQAIVQARAVLPSIRSKN